MTEVDVRPMPASPEVDAMLTAAIDTRRRTRTADPAILADLAAARAVALTEED